MPALPYDPVADFELRELESLPWSSTLVLLRRLVAQDAAAARRANYRTLLRELAADVPEPFAELPDGASPFYFPVRTDRKSQLLSRLADSGIKALDVWSATHPSVPGLPDSVAARRRATTVGLPVHQELGVAELERIVDAAAASPRTRPELRLERVADVDSLAGEWDALARRVGNIFATREWISAWWRHHGRDKEWLVTACRNLAGDLVAILPLYVSSPRPVRMLRFLGHGAGDRLGPICANADVVPVARALSRLLIEARTMWDVLLVEQIPADQRWGALLHGTHLRFEASPSLRVHWDGFEGFLASRSRNFREQVRGRERRLRREHRLHFRLSDEPGRLQADLTTLFGLHANRWGGGSQAFDGRRQAFHRDFAARALERGWLRLWFLELDDRPVSAWYGFRYAGAEWYYQGGRDPAFERAAVGFVLLSHTVRAAIEDGVSEYKLLRGDEQYKSRFANADDGLESFVVGRRLAGKAAAAGVAVAAALPPAARRPLTGLIG
ncbi:MAG: GNAT family N-acetyltransferase [Geodermatophilaceae bacterium]|nr:GNAT family N-acetyltransferase [Geodermatophilaceae bacterium]